MRTWIERLRADGHVVDSIAELSPGLPDANVLIRACQTGVVLITADKDFGELVYRHRRPHAGVLLLRLVGIDIAATCDLVSQVLSSQGSAMPGAFSVLGIDDLRIRRAPTDPNLPDVTRALSDHASANFSFGSSSYNCRCQRWASDRFMSRASIRLWPICSSSVGQPSESSSLMPSAV